MGPAGKLATDNRVAILWHGGLVISAANGSIVFDRGVVTQQLTHRQFRESALASGAKLVTENAGHRTYELAQPLQLDGRLVAASLLFTDEALWTVSLALADERFGTSWDDWSKPKQLARRAAHTKLLRTFFDGRGPRWELPWGVVESTFDERSGGSSIEIRYRGA